MPQSLEKLHTDLLNNYKPCNDGYRAKKSLLFQHPNHCIIIFRMMRKGTVCTNFYLFPIFFYIRRIPLTIFL